MQYALDPRMLPPGGVPVQCTQCRHVFIAAPPAQATPQTAANPNPALLFGADKTGTQPAVMTTQVFGAVPQVPPMAPVDNRPPPAPTGTPPSAMTTQVFGAVPQVPPVAPAGNKSPPAARPPPAAHKPPPGAAPAPMTTQAFGAVPQPSAAPTGQPARPPSASKTPPFGSTPQGAPVARPPASTVPTATTQVFGAVPEVPPTGQAPAGKSPSLSATQLFGNLPVPGAQAGGARGPQPGSTVAGPASRPPGMMPRATPQESPGAPATPESMVAVAATTPIELPEEILEQLNRPLSELLGEETSPEGRPSPGASPVPGLSKPLELPPELLNEAVESVNNAGGRGKRPETGRKGRTLLIAGGVLVLALTAFLTSPAWLSKSNAVPHEARVAREEAVALLRRDDSTSKEEALSRLKALSAAHPGSVELLAEVGIALAMHLDDTQVRATALREKEKRLQTRISRLSAAQTPVDWQSRVNTMRDELAATQRALTPLQERGAVLSKEAVQTLKRLDAIPEKEVREAALARLRGRALLNATLGGGEALGMAVQLAQAELRDWSTLTMAGYVLNSASPSETQVKETASALEYMREADKTFLRTYVLGARIALMRKEPAAAQALLDTVITLNPKHELAQQLHMYAGDLVNQEPEPETPPAPAPEATPTP